MYPRNLSRTAPPRGVPISTGSKLRSLGQHKFWIACVMLSMFIFCVSLKIGYPLKRDFSVPSIFAHTQLDSSASRPSRCCWQYRTNCIQTVLYNCTICIVIAVSCHCDPCHVLSKASDLLPTGQASIGGGEWGPKRGLLCGLAPWQRASNAYGAEFENQPQRLVVFLHKLDGNVLFFQLDYIQYSDLFPRSSFPSHIG